MLITKWFGALAVENKVGVGIVAVIALLCAMVAVPAAATASLTATTSTAPRSLADVPVVEETPEPVITTEKVVVSYEVPFAAVAVDDPALAAGTVAVTTTGVPGAREVTYQVTYRDGVETKRATLSETVTLAPVDQVTSNGTYVAPPPPPPVVAKSSCDPNYTGACVPIDSDVDCAGGSGNGPSYVTGPVRIVGSDIYDLDRDGDGIACD